MPDWTYLPLRPVAARLLGEARATRLALASAAALAATAPGRMVIRAVGGTRPPAGAARTVDGLACPSPVVVRVGTAQLEHALRVLPTLGAGLIEIGPVATAEVERVGAALRRRLPGVPVVVWAAEESTVDRLRAIADRVATEPVAAIAVTGPDEAGRAVAAGATMVAVTGAQLVADGPGLITRISEAIASRDHPPAHWSVGRNPVRWPGWVWAFLTGLGLVVGGLGATLITLGPVLLWYDRDFLGTGVGGLTPLSPHLIGFIQHDRISLAGVMVATGSLYIGFAGAMRHGWDWARFGLLASGLVGFPTLAYFLAWGFFEPLHTALTAVLLPMWYLAVRRPPRPAWRVAAPDSERLRRRALVGQLGLVAMGAGVTAGGIVISVVGLTGVFVPSDLVFLASTAHHLDAANPRLPAFIAHDRAGFGGNLMAAGVGIGWLAARGWRRGAAGTWWTLAVAGAAGWLPAIAIDLSVGYLDLFHLLPVYVGLVWNAIALGLAWPYLCGRNRSEAGTDEKPLAPLSYRSGGPTAPPTGTSTARPSAPSRTSGGRTARR